MSLILDVARNEIGIIILYVFSDLLKISFFSRIKFRFSVKSSSNLAEICNNSDLDMSERILMVEKCGKFVINDINEVCERYRELLVIVLSYLCVFGDIEVTVIFNEVIGKELSGL